MKNYKLTFLSLTLVIMFSAYSYAQDCKTGNHDQTKKETVKDQGCSEEMSCCDKGDVTNEKSTSLVKPWNEVCPVLGNKVDPKVKTVTYNGKAYGFCCAGCDAKFQKDPEKYSKNLSNDGKKFIKS